MANGKCKTCGKEYTPPFSNKIRFYPILTLALCPWCNQEQMVIRLHSDVGCDTEDKFVCTYCSMFNGIYTKWYQPNKCCIGRR